MDMQVDLSHSLVRRRPRAPRRERMLVAVAGSSLVAFLAAALALVGGLIGPALYLVCTALSSCAFALMVARLR